MCALSACRVCLASDREMYRLANTALEETYERVTSGTLVVEGRPCCVCGVCLSALRRCRRFIDTAREANDALDRWIRNQPNTDTLKFTERPLFSFTRTPTEIFEVTCQEDIWQSGVEQESDAAESEDNTTIHLHHENTSDNEGNILTEEIKYVTSDDCNDYTHASDEESDNTQISAYIESCCSSEISNFECVDIEDEITDVENDMQLLDDVNYNTLELSDDVGSETAPGTSNGGLRSRKRVKLNEDIESGPALKKRRPITSEHRRENTEPAAALLYEGNMKFYLCLQCQYKTANKTRMKEHLRIHTSEKPYVCDKCDYKCSQKSSLNRHIRIHMGDKPFACNKCDFKCNDNLKRHLRTHTGEKPYICDVCDYKCRSKDTLIDHLRIHTGEKPFTCDLCDYKTSWKSGLKAHLKIHAGEKRFACHLCDYRCNKKGALQRHLGTHTGKKPFACDKCDFKSNDKSNLKRHLRTHTGEKPFTCGLCDFKSSWRTGLEAHLKTHTRPKRGGKQFLCDKCDYKCSDRRTLYKHIMKVHAD